MKKAPLKIHENSPWPPRERNHREWGAFAGCHAEGTFLRGGKVHQHLNTVIKAGPGPAGIHVNGDDFSLGEASTQAGVVSLSTDVAGQTAEGVDGQNLWTAVMDHRYSLRPQQPSVSYGNPHGNVGGGLQLHHAKIRRGMEAELAQCIQHVPLERQKQTAQTGIEDPGGAGFRPVGIQVVLHIPAQPVYIGLAVAGFQIGKDAPVAQVAVLGVDIADDADSLFGDTGAGECGKGLGYAQEVLTHVTKGQVGAGLKILPQGLKPMLAEGFCGSGDGFIGAGLIAQ